MRPAGPLAALATIATLVATAVPATAATTAVDMVGFAYTPTTAKVTIGGSVTWTNQNPSIVHDAVDSTGLATFDSGDLDAFQTSAPVTPPLAGSFSYVCSFHKSMVATLVVRPKVGRQRTAGQPVTVTAASGPIAAGRVVEVQVRPKSGTWTALTVTNGVATWTPLSAGAYQVQARSRNTSGTKASGWATVSVTIS